jgi:hypothetical protein
VEPRKVAPNKVNQIAAPMGAGKVRPIGSKAAKTMLLKESFFATARLCWCHCMDRVNESNGRCNKEASCVDQNRRKQIRNIMKMAEMYYFNVGVAEGKSLLEKAKSLQELQLTQDDNKEENNEQG